MVKKQKKIQIFELICSYGKKIYGFKTYDNGKIIDPKPEFKKDYKINKSHGICSGCLSDVYMSIGLIPKYQNFKKNKKVEYFKNYEDYIEKEYSNFGK